MLFSSGETNPHPYLNNDSFAKDMSKSAYFYTCLDMSSIISYVHRSSDLDRSGFLPVLQPNWWNIQATLKTHIFFSSKKKSRQIVSVILVLKN